MVLNAAVQMLREADELKQKISKFNNGTSMLQERSLWATQQQLQKIYQKVLILDLEYALDKKVEQDLWNVGFKQQIEALQAISKDRKNPLRSEGQAMLSWVLQAAAGFYLCLLHQICTTFKLDLPFRRRASLLGWVEGWGAGEAPAGTGAPASGAARYICQHCLVHLGDLARYRHQLRVAHTFYRHAVVVMAQCGQPYNQLALVSIRRGRRLSALYWHVRSLMVRAPFPPATDNLARTLRTLHNANCQPNMDLPVLPGVVESSETSSASSVPTRLDSHAYVTELIRALHLIHNVEELETAAALVKSLNSSLTALVATDSFESMTLIKMAVVLIWLVHSTTEDMSLDSSSLTSSEAQAAHLSCELATGALLALLLPAYTRDDPPAAALPALKVWCQWAVHHTQMMRTRAWASRVALWAALAHNANALAPIAAQLPSPNEAYNTVPLPEDEELHGFVPLEQALKGLRFASHASWETYGGRIPDVENIDEGDTGSPTEVSSTCLSNEPELERRVRAYRLVQLGKRLAELRPEHFSWTEEDGRIRFTAASAGGEQLSEALAELSLSAQRRGDAGEGEGEDSEDEPTPPPPPIVISEADFREKVREKRVGILKPQGSLERAREERALASTQDDQETDSVEESSKSEDKKEAKKPRVNIAMAAIMRKQEETNKQVKFVTPPPTPDSTTESTDSKDQDKPKVVQPKVIKSLANLPLGRKTGGILSLKDKSAGYPHLVNTDPEPAKKVEKEEKKEPKPSQSSSQNSQSYQPKREQPQNWSTNVQNYQEAPRMSFQRNYGIPNTGISYNPNYQPNVNNQGIRLPVVNPKEIDVRTAALQKQNSRQDLFQEPKFNHNYQVSGDKKNFLNDLPPRFANQYRYWQNTQENQLDENKFRDDSFKNNSLFNNQNWMVPQNMENQQPTVWWKPENPPNFNTNYPMNVQQPNFYPPMNTMPNQYPTVPGYNPMQNINPGKQENVLSQPNYLQQAIGQPQLQPLQNLVTSPNFSSSMNNFNYPTAVGYDSSMYPQFGKLNYPMNLNVDKPNFPGKDLMDLGVGFGPNMLDMQHRKGPMNFNELNDSAMKMEQIGVVDHSRVNNEGPSNTYSLFSGATDPTAWGSAQQHPQQSLWSGPGPSPLERLLEQQKQMKQPPAPQ
ncbi:hypothetical protein K1T71_002995 [Dendrolimus kikuchii]|uniref:Uncharacterized protein n=1 Tax=Dendrolimus kikuchii TaxID=765133 RepID=A0ACC1DAP1_9NEOP|nr:hypothetical protein K1T71_002995 [Dendrolimus kikuchii]